MTCKKIQGTRGYRYVAISFVVVSFLLYAIMPFNLCLPFSYCVITGITVTMMAVSEIFFWVGGLMIGKEIVERIRQKFSIKNLLLKLRRRRDEE